MLYASGGLSLREYFSCKENRRRESVIQKQAKDMKLQRKFTIKSNIHQYV